MSAGRRCTTCADALETMRVLSVRSPQAVLARGERGGARRIATDLLGEVREGDVLGVQAGVALVRLSPATDAAPGAPAPDARRGLS